MLHQLLFTSDIPGLLGVPSIPIGPLLVTNVKDNACTLSWQPPENDGNSQILGYCIEKRDSKRSSWAFYSRTSKSSAEVSGLSEQASYYFRVAAENALGCGLNLETEQPVMLEKKRGTSF